MPTSKSGAVLHTVTPTVRNVLMFGVPIKVYNLPPTLEVDYTRPKRTHRKSRIRKKWAKRYGYHVKEVEIQPFMCGGVCYLTQRQLDVLNKTIGKTSWSPTGLSG